MKSLLIHLGRKQEYRIIFFVKRKRIKRFGVSGEVSSCHVYITLLVAHAVIAAEKKDI